MTQKLKNPLRNGDFSLGKRRPVGWRWLVIDGDAAWSFQPGRRPGERSLGIELGDAGGAGGLWQRVHCRTGRAYRLELVARRDSGVTGVGVRVGWRADGRCLHEYVWQANLPADDWRVWRQYVERPPSAAVLELQIGVRGHGGRCRLDAVRVIPVQQREESSHVLAAVPPPLAYPSPFRAARATVYGPLGHDSRLARWLACRLGARSVRRRDLAQLQQGPDAPEAVFIEDGPWPDASLGQLKQWGGRGLIVASLGAFERAVNSRGCDVVETRIVRQQLAPPAGRIVWASFITRGFALWDVLPYCWDPDASGWFWQRQIVATPQLKRLLSAEGFQIVVSSEAEYDKTSEHPLVLYRADRRGGGVLVMDAWLASSPASNLAENEPLTALLLNSLGRQGVSLGQYVVPAPRRRNAAAQVWELAKRYEAIEVTGPADRPLLRLSVAQRLGASRRILLRTGYDPTRWTAFYSVLIWLRSLARDVQMEGVGRLIAGRLQLAWDALADGDGSFAYDAPFDAVVDVVCGGQDRASVAVHRGPTWLGRSAVHIADALRNPAGEDLGFTWQDCRRDAPHEKRRRRFPCVDSATWLAIHLPDPGDAGLHRSMDLTDLGASLIEQIVGLQIGLVAANRTSHTRQIRIQRDHRLSGRYEVFDRKGYVAESGRLGAGELRRTLRPGWVLWVDREGLGSPRR